MLTSLKIPLPSLFSLVSISPTMVMMKKWLIWMVIVIKQFQVMRLMYYQLERIYHFFRKNSSRLSLNRDLWNVPKSAMITYPSKHPVSSLLSCVSMVSSPNDEINGKKNHLSYSHPKLRSPGKKKSLEKKQSQHQYNTFLKLIFSADLCFILFLFTKSTDKPYDECLPNRKRILIFWSYTI